MIFLVSRCCADLNSQGMFYYNWLEIKNGCSSLCLHQKEGLNVLKTFRSSVLLKKGVNRWTEKLNNGQASVVHEGAGYLPMTTTITNAEHTHRTDKWQFWMSQTVCILIMVLPMKSFTIDLAIIKLVQDEFQNTSQFCLNRCVLTLANICFAIIMTKYHSWTESSLVMKHGSFIISLRINTRLWNQNINNCLPRKSSKPNHQKKTDAYRSFFGTDEDYYSDIIRKEAHK